MARSSESATKLSAAIAPDTVVIITAQPAVRKPSRDFTILTN